MPQAIITTTASRVLRRNLYRKSFSFQHAGTTNFIYLEATEPEGVTTSNASIRLAAGASAVFNLNDDGEEQVQSPWTAIADAGSNTLLVLETFTKVPQQEKKGE